MVARYYKVTVIPRTSFRYPTSKLAMVSLTDRTISALVSDSSEEVEVDDIPSFGYNIAHAAIWRLMYIGASKRTARLMASDGLLST